MTELLSSLRSKLFSKSDSYPRIRKRTAAELAQAIADDADDLYFCPLPFEHVHNDNAGRWLLCCHAEPFDPEHTIFNATPEEHWSHPGMEQIRREMLSGDLDLVKTCCSKCLKLEEQGVPSPRTRFNKARHLTPEKNRKKGKNGRPTLECAARMTQKPGAGLRMEERVLELKLRIFGNYCNLRCYMCHPINSTSRIQELEKIKGGEWLEHMAVPERPAFFESDEYHEKFVASILNLLPSVKKIKITGGEPFLLKKHYEFLEQIIASGHAGEINLSYDSNMTVFQLGSQNVLDYLKHFRRVGIGVSVDNVGAKNDYIRHGSHFETTVRNIKTAQEFPNISVHVGCASGMLNSGDVHEVAEFFDGIGIEAKFNLCVINSPAFARAQHLPDELKRIYLERIGRSRFRDRFQTLVQMLELPRDESEFQVFIRYIRDLDAHRGTSVLALWPEFEPYFNESPVEA